METPDAPLIAQLIDQSRPSWEVVGPARAPRARAPRGNARGRAAPRPGRRHSTHHARGGARHGLYNGVAAAENNDHHWIQLKGPQASNATPGLTLTH